MNAPGERRLRVGPGLFDPLSGDLSLDGRTVRLRPRTAAFLSHLVQHCDRPVSKDELMEVVWPGVIVTEDSIVQCVKEIRQRAGERGARLGPHAPETGLCLRGQPAGGRRAGTGAGLALQCVRLVLEVAAGALAADRSLAGGHAGGGRRLRGARMDQPPSRLRGRPADVGGRAAFRKPHRRRAAGWRGRRDDRIAERRPRAAAGVAVVSPTQRSRSRASPWTCAPPGRRWACVTCSKARCAWARPARF